MVLLLSSRLNTCYLGMWLPPVVAYIYTTRSDHMESNLSPCMHKLEVCNGMYKYGSVLALSVSIASTYHAKVKRGRENILIK